MKKIYDFTKTTKTIQNVSDAIIKEKLIKNTKFIDYSTKNKEKILQNYIDYCNYKASFIKNDYCFGIFIKYFNIYKNNNINIEFNAINSKIKFLENEKNKRLVNCSFNNNTIKDFYKLFLNIKNDR